MHRAITIPLPTAPIIHGRSPGHSSRATITRRQASRCYAASLRCRATECRPRFRSAQRHGPFQEVRVHAGDHEGACFPAGWNDPRSLSIAVMISDSILWARGVHIHEDQSNHNLATGMVGEGVLLECLRHPDVEQILIINRRPVSWSHQKLRENIHSDFFDLAPIEPELSGYKPGLLQPLRHG